MAAADVDEKLGMIVARVREVLARDPDWKPALALVSYQDAEGTELAFKPIDVDGVRVDSSRLVPPGHVLVDAG